MACAEAQAPTRREGASGAECNSFTENRGPATNENAPISYESSCSISTRNCPESSHNRSMRVPRGYRNRPPMFHASAPDRKHASLCLEPKWVRMRLMRLRRPAAAPVSLTEIGSSRYHEFGRARRGASGALYSQSALARLDSSRRSSFRGLCTWPLVLRVGSHAAKAREPRQVRKEAAVSGVPSGVVGKPGSSRELGVRLRK